MSEEEPSSPLNLPMNSQPPTPEEKPQEQAAPAPTSRRAMSGRRQNAPSSQQLQQPSNAGGLTQPVNQLAGQVGQTAQGATDAVAGSGSGKNTLKLRLDLNLDVDVHITAKVHGDVTLSLL